VNLCIPLPPNPADPFEVLYDCLVEFVAAMTDKDNKFAVFPYHLSSYKDMDNLPPPIYDPDLIPDDIDEWCRYFSDAKPRAWGGNLYTLASVGQFWQTLCQSHEIDGAMVSQEKVWYLAIGTPVGETNLSRMVAVLDTSNGYQYLKSCYHDSN